MLRWLTYHIRRYFGSSRTHTYGLLLLLCFTILILATPLIYRFYLTHYPPPIDPKEITLLDEWMKILQETNQSLPTST